jgi:regulator of telomere elongation helicase 1
MRDRLKDADLQILPYNYVLDTELREQINLDLTDAVVIFDEGHNIESNCEELFQFELGINDLFMSYNVLNQVWAEL